MRCSAREMFIRNVRKRRETSRRREVRADCFTRDGFRLTDCTLSVWRRLKKKGLIASRGGGPYRVNRDGLARLRSQLDNRVSERRW